MRRDATSTASSGPAWRGSAAAALALTGAAIALMGLVGALGGPLPGGRRPVDMRMSSVGAEPGVWLGLCALLVLVTGLCARAGERVERRRDGVIVGLCLAALLGGWALLAAAVVALAAKLEREAVHVAVRLAAALALHGACLMLGACALAALATGGAWLPGLLDEPLAGGFPWAWGELQLVGGLLAVPLLGAALLEHGRAASGALRACVLAPVFVICVGAAVDAWRDAAWSFGWTNPHYFQHFAALAAVTAGLQLLLAASGRDGARLPALLRACAVALAASLGMERGGSLVLACACLVIYGVGWLRQSRAGVGRRGIWARGRSGSVEGPRAATR